MMRIALLTLYRSLAPDVCTVEVSLTNTGPAGGSTTTAAIDPAAIASHCAIRGDARTSVLDAFRSRAYERYGSETFSNARITYCASF